MTATHTKTRAAPTDPLLPPPQKGIRKRGIALHDSLDRQSRFQQTIHAAHWDQRAIVMNALADPTAPKLNPTAHRMSHCGQGASFYIDPSNETVRPWLSRCGSRLCPFCSNARSATATAELLDLMIEHHCDRTVILTLRSHDLPLDLQVAQLLHCFKKLRARKTWKSHVTGGVYILEITRNATSGLWHPHIHALIRGQFYPHAELSKAWRDITVDSNIVWLSKVRDLDGMARELGKYIGKPQHIASLPPEAIREYAYATKSVRMLQTFGDLHGRKPRDEDQTEPKPRTDQRVRLSTLMHIARSGHAEAIVLLTWLCQRFPIFGQYVHHEMPQLTPDPGPADRTLELLAHLRGETPPPRAGPDNELTDDELDHKISQAFVTYQAQLELGTFHDVHFYHRTETEQIDGNFRR